MMAGVIAGIGLLLGAVDGAVQMAARWRRSRRLWALAGVLTFTAAGLITWAAHLHGRSWPSLVLTVPWLLLAACLASVCAGAAAFITWMADVRHRGWGYVLDRLVSKD